MPLRKQPQPGRRYFSYPYAPYVPPYAPPKKRPEYYDEPRLSAYGGLEEIPLPNEVESPRPENVRTPRGSIIDFLKERITLEEIILIGLIILLLNESIADEILLIALVYILLF